MDINEIQLIQRVQTPRNISLEIQSEDVATRLAEERARNEEIKRQLTLEKARADRLQKKVQFIQDNQDLFNQLKEAYSTIKLAKGNIVKVEARQVQTHVKTEKEIQDSSSQTNTLDFLKNTQITAVNKKDLEEVSQLIQELKFLVTRGGNRVFAALETDKARDKDERKRIEMENIQLKRELYHKSTELERLRSSVGSGPREITLLRRIITKMINAGNDLSCLSSREVSLVKYLARKYEKRFDPLDERKMLEHPINEQELNDEKLVGFTPYDSIMDPITPNTPRSPQTPKSEYCTPRWTRLEDIP